MRHRTAGVQGHPLRRHRDTGWLTIFYTPSRRTLWFPLTDPVPDLNLEQNCYLGIGIRREKTR